jgi:uncharacterized protein YecE (DUF72 family)
MLGLAGRDGVCSTSSMVRRFRVGCSGWHYRDWAGRVYPRDLPTDRWLSAYTRQFDTVELNNSFYRLPEAEQFARWRREVPRGFEFAVKASRFLTHFKRLIDPEEPLDRLLSRARHLGPALGPILYQLPPGWLPPLDRFEHFLARLPRRLSPRGRPLVHVVEFRDPRGYEPGVLEMLARYDVALCVHDMPGSGAPRVAVGPIVYVRLHGYEAKYGGSYPDEVLADWAVWLRGGTDPRPAYVYFNNDRHAHAVRNAQVLAGFLDVRPTVRDRASSPDESAASP